MAISCDTFFDVHCHLFTVADVPLNRSLGRAIEVIDKKRFHPLAIILSPLFGPASMLVDVEKKLKSCEAFIKFMEREPEQNTAKLVAEVWSGLSDGALGEFAIQADRTVLTPLVMDFDRNGQVEKLHGQVERLKKACPAHGRRDTKVLPFLGLDPRRGLDEVRRWLDGQGAGNRIGEDVRSIADRGGLDQARDGDLVGIKLYPPLGFDVYPDGSAAELETALAVYKEFEQRGLPVTAHCQTSSFSLTRDDDETEEFTRAQNWTEVMRHCPNLRVNFAHFGGEDGVAAAVQFDPEPGAETGVEVESGHLIERDFFKLNPSSWTYRLVEMLKVYPNTYADLGAFEFLGRTPLHRRAQAALMWILAEDHNDRIKVPGAKHKLEDKLLWGSDYPMMLGADGIETYADILRGFARQLRLPASALKSEWKVPTPGALPELGQLVKKLVCDNPRRFLSA